MHQREIDHISIVDIARFQQTGQMTEGIEQYFREVTGIADARKISICSSRPDIAEQINQSHLPEEAVLYLRIKHLEKEAAFYVENVMVNSHPSKIHAIKLMRFIKGWDLKESKDWVEDCVANGERRRGREKATEAPILSQDQIVDHIKALNERVGRLEARHIL